MTDRIWEPLAELDLNLSGSENAGIYCLCSRALIRCKINNDSWEELLKERLEKFEMVDEPGISDCDPSERAVEGHSFKKQEVEAVSCYCSASHYSTDDYESVIQSASDYQSTSKDQFLPCPLQNSDSGADLSENFTEKPCCRTSGNLELILPYSKSKLETAWEKYWSENGESIIWKSWIEKYGAYINPNYLEQNSFCESFDLEISDLVKEESLNENEMKLVSNIVNAVEVNNTNHSNSPGMEDETTDMTEEKIPVLKVSSYPSCGNLLDNADNVQKNKYIDESDAEDKILKSSSFGSYASYERVRYSGGCGGDDDKLKNNDNERVRSRCSNTNLSVKSAANTTVTTDSMTNVTKITLSSLDLSCECESVKSSSLLSTSSEDSSGLSSTSSSSSKEEICTEADMWWRKVWKEHYEDQYASSYQIFLEKFDFDEETKNLESEAATVDTTRVLMSGGEEKETNLGKSNAFQTWKTFNSPDCYLQGFDSVNVDTVKDSSANCNDHIECSGKKNVVRTCGRTDDLKRQLENSEDSCDDVEEINSKWRKKVTPKKQQKMGRLPQKREKLVRKMDNIKQAMTLMGFSFKSDLPDIQSGYVTYRKKNIRGQNRRLRLCDGKPKTHLFFDDEGNPFEAKPSELDNFVLPVSDGCEKKDVSKREHDFVEPESLGYEAHSSSMEGVDDLIDENKKQKKKRKRQRKYSLPQEILDNKRLLKYWLRRYQLFSKFDSGIKLDTESWYSVTPEQLAKHHAERCRCDVIVDAFCGAGGNSIQFAFTCERVIAVDIDPLKIEMAKHNAKIYGVEERIEFIVGDFIKLASNLRADVVFLSPPWGGPDYVSHDAYSLENILPPLGGEGLFRLASEIAEDVAYFLPKNTNSTEVALLCGPGGGVEIEQNFMDRRLGSVTAYFGGLIMDPEDPYL